MGEHISQKRPFTCHLGQICDIKKITKILTQKQVRLLLSYLIIKNGIEVFSTSTFLKAWLNKPAYGLGDEHPLNLLNIITGIDPIEEELIRIKYGALA